MLRPSVFVFAAALILTTPASAQTVSEALAAYRDNRAAEADRMFAAIAADPAASDIDRASAHTERARIDWMLRGESDAAAEALAQIPASAERCLAAALALRIFRDSGAAAAPVAAAREGRELCAPGPAQDLRVQLARSYMAIGDPASLALAATELSQLEPAAASSPDVASARLSLALLQRDAAAAFGAWRDYFWLADTDVPPALTAHRGRVQAIFAAGLAPQAPDADVIDLIGLLIRVGFADDARRLAEQSGIAARAGDDPEWVRAAAYLQFRRDAAALTLRANRDLIAGRGAAYYEREMSAAMGALMQAAGLSGDPRDALREAYGAYGTIGETSGYPSMHAGHIVQDDRMRVTQYGRSGDLRFIVLDCMIANGYESWLWDGWAEAGGWSSDGNTIVQVRSAYTDGPLRVLRRTRPGPERDRFIANIEREEADELRALGRDGVAPLPATESRLLLQAYDQIAARVGDDDAAFIAEVWRGTNQTSIESHEGRHALDNIEEPGLSVAQLEFRAKLSQIVFADYPRLGLASVAGGEHNATGHGRGNRRVLEGYRRWMRAHRGEIAGFDPDRPTLSQLHLLTDAQIVDAARAMDPWAR